MQGVYVVYSLADPATRRINLLDRYFFNTDKEHTIAITNVNYKKDRLDANTAIARILYDASGTPTIEPWAVPPRNSENAPETETVWRDALKNKASYLRTHAVIQVKYPDDLSDTDDLTDLPLYSKIYTSEKDQLIIYATQSGDTIVVLEFKNNLFNILHYGALDTSQPVPSYPIFNVYSFAEFENVYAFRFKAIPSSKTLQIYDPKPPISYTNDACLIKPILQTRGFCYYHAVLHGLLIPPNFQWICYYKLLEYMKWLKSNTDDRYNLERFMNIDICEDFKSLPDHLTEDTRYFVMKFFYQYLFHYEDMVSLVNKNEDNIIDTLHQSSPTIQHPHPVEILVGHTKHKYYIDSLKTLPEGGSSAEIFQILFYNVMRLNVRLSDDTSTIYSSLMTYTYDAPTRTFSSKKKIQLNRREYSLEIGMIGIDYFKLQNNREVSGGHAIVGINCNGKKYIIDSADGYIGECDWTTIQGILRNSHIQSFLTNIESKENQTIKEIDISYYFIRKNIEEKYDHPNPREDIKKQFIYPKIMKAIASSGLEPSVKKKLLYLEGIENTSAIKHYESAHPETWTLPGRRGGANTLTVKELQARCAKRKLAYAGLRKAELVALLRRR